MKSSVIGVIFFAAVFSTALNSAAQGDSCNVYTYGGSNNDYARQIISTSDSGYIVVGTTSSFGVALTDLYIIKTDSNGVKQWSHFYGSDQIDWGYSIRETFDQGFIVTGFTNQVQSTGYDIYLLKLNSIGEVQWSKTIGGTDWDFGYGIELTPDSGFIICGRSYSFSNGGSDAYIVKTNSMGDVLWQKNYGDEKDQTLNAIIRDHDNNYGLVGVTTSSGSDDQWVLKIDGNGDTLWTTTYGGARMDVGNAIDTTTDGGFVTNGTTNSYAINGTDSSLNMMLIKTTSSGGFLWRSLQGDTIYRDEGYALKVLPNGDILNGGITESYGLGKSAFYFIRNDPNGFWIPNAGGNFGGTEKEEGYSVALGKNNQLLFAGITDTYGCGLFDVYLIRLDTFVFFGEFPSIFHYTCDTTIGVLEHSNLEKIISIYPNPANDKVHIDFIHSTTQKANYTIVVRDIAGQESQLISTDHFPVMLDIKGMSNGFYSVSLYDDLNLLGTEKLIVY